MARKPVAKREVIGIRLDVWNERSQSWMTPDFSFQFRQEALNYRERHYPSATKYRVYKVRMKTDFGIPPNFYFNSLLAEKKAA